MMIRYRCSALPLVLFLLFLLTACAPAVRSPSFIDHTLAQAANGPTQEYRIQPGDQLEVKFFYNPELNEQVTVRPDGLISLQLANEITAAGMTPARLTDLLISKYAAELNNPVITVMVRTFATQRVYVDGEVGKPGLVNLVASMTALQTISQAGGLKDSARLNEVVIVRRTADNKKLNLVINLQNALDGSDKNQDIVLLPLDIVYVPKSHIANVNQWVDEYIRKNLPISASLGIPIY